MNKWEYVGRAKDGNDIWRDPNDTLMYIDWETLEVRPANEDELETE